MRAASVCTAVLRIIYFFSFFFLRPRREEAFAFIERSYDIEAHYTEAAAVGLLLWYNMKYVKKAFPPNDIRIQQQPFFHTRNRGESPNPSVPALTFGFVRFPISLRNKKKHELN